MSRKVSSQDFLDLLEEQSSQPSFDSRSFLNGGTSVDPNFNSDARAHGRREPAKADQFNWGVPSSNPPTTKPTDKPTDVDRKTYGKPAEKTRMDTTKPTDKPTDVDRKTYGKPTDVDRLVGHQRQAFFALSEAAWRDGFSDDLGNRITPRINGAIFALETLKRAYKQAKDVIYELKIAGYIDVFQIKSGRGGFVQYLIPKLIYSDFLRITNSTENLRKIHGKPTDKPTDKPTETGSVVVVSSSEDFKNNNYGEASLNIPGEVRALGLTATSFSKVPLSMQEVQDSLDAFAFDVREKKLRARSSPQALLIGTLNSGRPYVSSGFASALAADVAEATARFERVEVLKNQQAELEDLIEFEKWRKTASEECLLEVVPRGETISSTLWERLVKQAFLDGRFNERKPPLEEK